MEDQVGESRWAALATCNRQQDKSALGPSPDELLLSRRQVDPWTTDTDLRLVRGVKELQLVFNLQFMPIKLIQLRSHLLVAVVITGLDLTGTDAIVLVVGPLGPKLRVVAIVRCHLEYFVLIRIEQRIVVEFTKALERFAVLERSGITLLNP